MLSRAVLVVPQIVEDFTDDHTLALMMWLVCKANQNEDGHQHKLKDGTVIRLGKNQVFLNVSAYAKRRGVSRKVVRTRLSALEKRATIGTQVVHRRGLIVTVANLEKYQSFGNYKRNGAKGGATSGPQQGTPYHSDNHSDDHPTTPRAKRGGRKHWSEPHGSRLAAFADCPKSGPWSYLGKLAREHKQESVLAALAELAGEIDAGKIANWSHAKSWLGAVVPKKAAKAGEDRTW